MEKLKKIGLPLLSVVTVCFYPCAFLYFQNAGEARAMDMLPFFGIFLLTAAGIFLIVDILLRNIARAAVVTNLAMLAVMNFTMVCNGIKGVFPGFRDKIFLIAVLVVLAVLLWVLLKKKPNMTVVCGLFLLVFGIQVVIQGAMAAPTLIAAATHHREDVSTEEAVGQTFSGETRNVYYMMFDEYGGSENLKHFYDYDNEEFLTALEDRGFTVSRTSKNTESPWTVTLIPNMVNLDYVTSDAVPINSRLEWLEEPALYRLFWENGYQVNLVNHDGFLSETGCRVLTQDQSQETISVYLYENSIFCLIPKLKWVIEEKVLHRGENGYERALENTREAMVNCCQAVDGPTLTVSYMIAPHAPFLFGPGEKQVHREDYYNWERPELYLSKLEYTNEAILEAVDNIQKNDPNAVIFLQADHGARIPGHLVEQFGEPWFDTEVEIPYMEGVLNCVYVPGDSVDIEGDTCINATRKTLDRVFGLSLGTLPVPPDYTIPDEYMPPPPPKPPHEDQKHDEP